MSQPPRDEKIDDLEDIYLAEQRLEDIRAGRSKSHTVDEVERDLGLAGWNSDAAGE